MKKISIVTSCFNEEDNIPVLYRELNKVTEKYLSKYEFEIIIIDNASTDGTYEYLKEQGVFLKQIAQHLIYQFRLSELR